MFHPWWATTVTNSTTIYHLLIVFLWVGERAALGKGFEIAAFKLRRFFESLILLKRPEGGASTPLSKDCAWVHNLPPGLPAQNFESLAVRVIRWGEVLGSSVAVSETITGHTGTSNVHTKNDQSHQQQRL